MNRSPWQVRAVLTCVFALLCVVSNRANAEVDGAAANGFRIKSKVLVEASPRDVYESFLDVAKWWDASHSYTQKATNFYLEPAPKGWFGERLPDGGFVKHLEIVYLAPGKAIRLAGGLGPLQAMGASAALTIQFAEVADHPNQTELRWVYVVSGYDPKGLDKLAGPVDGVLGLQMRRLKRFAEKQ